MTIKLVQNDTRPAVYVVLDDPDTGEVFDLTGATAVLHFRAIGATTIKADVPGTLIAGFVEDDGTVTTDAPYDVAGAGGRVRFDWSAGDLDTPGAFQGEIEVTFPDTTRHTTYRTLSFYVREEFA